MDSVGLNGVRTIGLDFSGGIGAMATALDTALGAAISVSNPSGSVVRVLDDGGGGTTDINSLDATHAAQNVQDGTLALPLFVDTANATFTNSLDGIVQKTGFAARISVNAQVKVDNTLLVKYSATASLGDASRVNRMWDQLSSLQFTGDLSATRSMGQTQIAGTVSSMLSQTLAYQGASVEKAQSVQETRKLAAETMDTRMKEEYGVDVNKEMARLMEFQTAYAANARVLSTVQDLLKALMQI